MATANLGITVDTSSVAGAVADLDKIAPAAARAEQATTKLAQTTTQKLSETASQTENFARRIEKALNIKAEGVDMGRAADIEAYGRSLDQLRQKFNQAHSIMQSYRSTAAEIRQANAVGAISVNEMNAALERLRITTTRQVEAERALRAQRASGGGGGGSSAGMNRMLQTNMMYQLQDVAVTASMGMNPAMIALQQGGQLAPMISQVMAGGGGIRAGLSAIGAGVMGMINPVSIATMAVIGLGSAFISWATSADEKVKTLDQLMKEHAETVQNLAKAYGLVGVTMDDLMHKSPELALAKETKALDDLTKKAHDAAGALFGMNQSDTMMGKLRTMLGVSGSYGPLGAAEEVAGGGDVNSKFAAFEGPIRKLRDSIAAGKADFNGFYAAVMNIAKAEGIEKLGLELIELTKDAHDATEQIQSIVEIQRQLNELADKKAAIDKQVADAQTDTQRLNAAKALSEFEHRNLDDKYKTLAVNRDIAKVEADISREKQRWAQQQDQQLTHMIQGEQARLEAMRMTQTEGQVYQQRVEAIAAIEEEAKRRGIAASDEAYKFYQRQIDKTNEYYDTLLKIKKEEEALQREREKAQNDAAIQGMQARTDAEKVAAAIAAARAGKVGSDADFAGTEAERLKRAELEKQTADATRQRHQALDDLLKSQEHELELIGKTNSEQAALREEFRLTDELRRQAAERGIAVDEKEIELIKQKTAEYGKLVAQLERQKLVQDIVFERSLLHMNEEDRKIAERLRGTGIGLDSPEAAYIRETDRIAKVQDFARDTAKDFLSGFSDVLTAGGEDMGENLVKALKDSANRALDKILDSLFDSIIDSLLGTRGGGTGGGIGGAIGEALGASLKGSSGGGGSGVGGTASALLNLLGGGGGGGGGSTDSAAAQVAGSTVKAQAWNYFASKGLTSNQISGIMGNMQAESAFNPAAVGDNGNAFGLFQWNSRGPAMKNFVGSDWKTDVKGQLDFAWHELNTSESGTLAKLRQAGSPREAAYAFGGFERPRGYSAAHPENMDQAANRVKYAEQLNEQFKKIGGSGGSAEKLDESVAKTAETVTGDLGKSMKDLSGITDKTVGSLASFSGGMDSLANGLKSFMSSPSGGGSGWFSGLSNMFGGAGGALNFMSDISPAATASIIGAGGGFTGLFHEGNIGASMRSRHFPSMAPWVNAPRLHGGNVFGNLMSNLFAAGEYPAVLRKGEPVFPSMAAAQATLGGKTFVNVHNYSGSEVRTSAKEHREGTSLDIIVDRMVADNISDRGTASNNVMRGKYGMQERLRVR
jgi:Phage tail lysozyme/Prophage tail length tape measure protein